MGVSYSLEFGGCGYRVEVTDEAGNTRLVYNAGNNRHESTTYSDKDSPWAIPPKELLKLARQTAVEFAELYGMTEADVYHDTDSEEP